jgi:hypothetical protein
MHNEAIKKMSCFVSRSDNIVAAQVCMYDNDLSVTLKIFTKLPTVKRFKQREKGETQDTMWKH